MNQQIKKELKQDKWAMRAIEYLVRKDFSTQEVIEAMAIVGIKKGKINDKC